MNARQRWDFIMDNLPKYHSRDDVLHIDMIQRFIDFELHDLADIELVKSYGKTRKKLKRLVNKMENQFLDEILN